MARDAVKKNSFEPFVGAETYDVWIKMLKNLVPHGRTHRLAVVVAGMIQYATDSIYKKDPDLYDKLFDRTDDDYHEVENRELIKYVENLFQDANVRSSRTNSRGQAYSIVESALIEHERWDNMPWE